MSVLEVVLIGEDCVLCLCVFYLGLPFRLDSAQPGCLYTRIRRLDPPLAGPTSGIRALALLLVKTKVFLGCFFGFLKFTFSGKTF
uniref:Uncharacterized protein n=1 Tax=Helianthus annuus TaxID=4232 RepID=A0A251SZM2_HELAN